MLLCRERFKPAVSQFSPCAGYKLADVAEPKGDEFRKAVSVLLPYLLSHRTRLASVEHDDDEEEEADRTNAEKQQSQESITELSELTAEERATLAEAVDTAILKVCQQGRQTLASPSQIRGNTYDSWLLRCRMVGVWWAAGCTCAP